MTHYAVIDTNVIVSALITKNPQSPPRQIFRAMLNGTITALYHEDILAEYEEVLSRDKFHLKPDTVQTVMKAIRSFGVEINPKDSGETLTDMDDLSCDGEERCRSISGYRESETLPCQTIYRNAGGNAGNHTPQAG